MATLRNKTLGYLPETKTWRYSIAAIGQTKSGLDRMGPTNMRSQWSVKYYGTKASVIRYLDLTSVTDRPLNCYRCLRAQLLPAPADREHRSK